VKELSPFFIHRDFPESEDPEFAVLDDEEEFGFDPWKYWWIIRKNLVWALAVPAVLLVVVGLRDLMATRLYTAEATILIHSSEPAIFDQASISPAPETGEASSSEMDYQTEYDLLKSRSLAAKVIASERLAYSVNFADGTPARARGAGGDSSQATRQALISSYLSQLKVMPVEGTRLVKIEFTTPNPQLSARLANAHIREFINQGIALNTQASDQTADFLQQKLAQIKRQLEDSELALNNYRRDKGIIPGLISVNGKEDVILDRLNKLSEELQDAHLKVIELGAQLALSNKGEAEALPAVIENSLVQKLKGDLDGLEAQYASMTTELKPNYPPVHELQTKIDRTRTLLKEEIAGVESDIRAQYSAAVDKEKELQQDLEKEKNFALGLNEAAVRYTILQREADTNRELYNAVLKRLKDVSLVADDHASRISVVDSAVLPLAPSSPNKRRDLFTAGMLGLAGGIALCFLLDYLDNRLKTPAEARRYLRLPVMGTIPAAESLAGRGTGDSSTPQIGRYQSTPNQEVVPSYGGYSVVDEAYGHLRATLLLSRAGAPPKTIVITSAEPKEGKTVTAVNTAIAFAHTSPRVLLIDADLRKPSCHKFLSMKNHNGLSDVLAGTAELEARIHATSIAGMFFLSSGKIPPNPAELLASDKMKETLKYLAEQYDHIVIDTSPVLRVSDPLFLAAIADGTMVVVDVPQTPKQHVREAITRLTQARAKILGSVFNKVHVGGFGYGYYASYYYRSGYYSSVEGEAGEGDAGEANPPQ
jgi:polysaccharide biosynthesis transport protein